MKKRLLVVDDSIFIWEEMKRITRDTEFEIVGFAKNGEDALRLYEEQQPDVVTMDIILPGADGLDVTKELIGRWPEAKVIVVSSLAYDETMKEAGEVGACGFTFKPIECEDFLAALRKAL